MAFEWSESKAAANIRKHGVSFEEAKTVFDNPMAVIFDDEVHFVDEQREIIIGHSRKIGCFWFLSPSVPTLFGSSGPVQLLEGNVKTTNKIPFDESANFDDEMLPEYHFDYQKAKPNRFAAQSGKKMTVVVLDEDVAQVFTTPESVNKALKALIEVVPRISLEAGDSQDANRFQEQFEQPQKSSSIAEIRKQYPRAYEAWNADEDEQLRLQYGRRTSVNRIATEFQRQPSAIRSRLKKLGLL